MTQFEYRCRRCGRKFRIVAPETRAIAGDVITGDRYARAGHRCRDDGIGVGDLLGIPPQKKESKGEK